jgi:hypothetical protein
VRALAFIVVATLIAAGCTSGHSGDCGRPYVPSETVSVPYVPTCEASDAGCDLICQEACPAPPDPRLYLQSCSLVDTAAGGDSGADAGAFGPSVSCAYWPYPDDPICT